MIDRATRGSHDSRTDRSDWCTRCANVNEVDIAARTRLAGELSGRRSVSSGPKTNRNGNADLYGGGVLARNDLLQCVRFSNVIMVVARKVEA